MTCSSIDKRDSQGKKCDSCGLWANGQEDSRDLQPTRRIGSEVEPELQMIGP